MAKIILYPAKTFNECFFKNLIKKATLKIPKIKEVRNPTNNGPKSTSTLPLFRILIPVKVRAPQTAGMLNRNENLAPTEAIKITTIL